MPDLATLDMTWIPTLAANGALEDLTAMSGGQLNGQPIESQYTKGALEAMTFDQKYVTMLYDFDTYALYYRSDLFDQKGISVPTDWDELRAAAKQLAEASKTGGKPDKYLYAIRPNTFHFSQFLFQEGGSILDRRQHRRPPSTRTPAWRRWTIQKRSSTTASGKYWPDADGDLIPAITVGRGRDVQ